MQYRRLDASFECSDPLFEWVFLPLSDPGQRVVNLPQSLNLPPVVSDRLRWSHHVWWRQLRARPLTLVYGVIHPRPDLGPLLDLPDLPASLQTVPLPCRIPFGSSLGCSVPSTSHVRPEGDTSSRVTPRSRSRTVGTLVFTDEDDYFFVPLTRRGFVAASSLPSRSVGTGKRVVSSDVNDDSSSKA